MSNPFQELVTTLMASEDGLKAILAGLKAHGYSDKEFVPTNLTDLCELVNKRGGVAAFNASELLENLDEDFIAEYLRDDCQWEFVCENGADVDVDLDLFNDVDLARHLRGNGWLVHQKDDLESIDNEALCDELKRRLC
jgi:hypothetical protein